MTVRDIWNTFENWLHTDIVLIYTPACKRTKYAYYELTPVILDSEVDTFSYRTGKIVFYLKGDIQ